MDQLTIRQGVYIYCTMPSYMQFNVIRNMGVDANIETAKGAFVMNKQFFQFVKDFKLEQRFLFELPFVSEWHCTEYLNARS